MQKSTLNGTYTLSQVPQSLNEEGGEKKYKKLKDSKECYEIMSSRHDMVITPMNSQQLA